jgi:hypothetical protein
MAVEFQKDFKINQVTNAQGLREKLTLELTPTGDISLVEGKSKLAEQLMRSVVNDAIINESLVLNTTTLSPQHLTTLVTLILRNFRQSQINQTARIDPDFTGYSLWRFDNFRTNAEFQLITTKAVTTSFLDSDLQNGLTYTYGIKKSYRGITESAIIEQLDAIPSQFANNREASIGDFFILVPGDKSVSIYVNYYPYVQTTELLESIEEIKIEQDQTEPRRYIVNITVRNLEDDLIGLSTQRFNIII